MWDPVVLYALKLFTVLLQQQRPHTPQTRLRWPLPMWRLLAHEFSKSQLSHFFVDMSISFASSLCLFSGGWWTHGARPWRLIDWRRRGLFQETFGCNIIGVILASLLFQSSWRFLWTYLGQGHRRIRPTNILDNECETIATPPRYLPTPAMWGPSKLPVLQHTAFWHLALLNPCNLVQSQQVCIILASAYQSCMICSPRHSLVIKPHMIYLGLLCQSISVHWCFSESF